MTRRQRRAYDKEAGRKNAYQKQEEAKKVFEDLFKSSLIIPTFGPNGQFTFF